MTESEEISTLYPVKTLYLAEFIDVHLLELHDEGKDIDEINAELAYSFEAGVTLVVEGEWFEADSADWIPQTQKRLDWLVAQRDKRGEQEVV